VSKRWMKLGVGALAAAGAGFLVVTAWYVVRAAPVGTGFTAKYLCSSYFIAGQDPRSAFSEDVAPVNPLAGLVRWRIDRRQMTATADILGFFKATALYRQGCGCTLLAGASEAELRRQTFFRMPPAAGPVAGRGMLPWPRGRGAAEDPAGLGVDREMLAAALDRAFTEPGAQGQSRRTRAVVVVYRGHLIAERYAAGFKADMPFPGWSMAKSVTNAMVGVLVRHGLLHIDAPAPVPRWRQPDDPRGRITLDHLLRMSSGLEFEEIYTPLRDAARMLYTTTDFAAYAADKPLAARPGDRWHYSSGPANIVAGIVRRAAEKQTRPYYGFFYRELFHRIGMQSVVLEPDPSGTFAGSSYIWATARDWARFGLLYLRDGVWDGRRILPDGWVAYTVTPAPAAPRGEYGALFWLNAGPAADPSRRLWPHAPRDTFAAQGFRDQKLFIIPSRALILVRFGATSGRSAWSSDEFIADILAALPADEPGSPKGPRKNNFRFYPSRLQAIFVRSEGAKSSKELAIPPVLRPQIEQI
jgi:CubicO group peptidase (beta-lactamase class C family)